MYAVIRKYTIGSGATDAWVQRLNECGVPAAMGQIRGCRGWYALDLGNGGCATIGLFEDQAGAEESTKLASDLVRERFADLRLSPPEVFAGEVRATATPETPWGLPLDEEDDVYSDFADV